MVIELAIMATRQQVQFQDKQRNRQQEQEQEQQQLSWVVTQWNSSALSLQVIFHYFSISYHYLSLQSVFIFLVKQQKKVFLIVLAYREQVNSTLRIIQLAGKEENDLLENLNK